jgi:hypothetical protein
MFGTKYPCIMNTNNIADINNVGLNIGLLAIQQENPNGGNDVSYNLGVNILETALQVNKHLALAEVSGKSEISKEILRAYVKCNRLMAFMIHAYQKAEISRQQFLHFEIELKNLMSRLEIACEKASFS